MTGFIENEPEKVKKYFVDHVHPDYLFLPTNVGKINLQSHYYALVTPFKFKEPIHNRTLIIMIPIETS